eukprot:scaffold57_cov254-Pinguiococcus_pyrenoidosus.AAC.7
MVNESGERSFSYEVDKPLATPDLRHLCKLKRVVDEEPLLAQKYETRAIMPALEAAAKEMQVKILAAKAAANAKARAAERAAERAAQAAQAEAERQAAEIEATELQRQERPRGRSAQIVWTIAVAFDIAVLAVLSSAYFAESYGLGGLPRLA